MSTSSSSISPGAAEAEHAAASSGGPLLVAVAVPFLVYAIALALVSALFPYRPALDDNEWLYLAHSVAERGQLAADGVFMRVPLWQLMLGSLVGWAGDRASVLGLQAVAVLGAFVLLARRRLPDVATSGSARWHHSAMWVGLLFAVSPQLVLYSRHAATELWIGLFAMAVVSIGERSDSFDVRRAGLLGLVIGAATMTKLAAAVLALPALLYLWHARERLPALHGLAAAAAGFAVVVVPLVVLTVVQRGLPLDDTSAFNLGPLDIEAWEAAGGSAARSALSMQAFGDLFASDPLGYLIGIAGRAVDWFAWPSSLDLRVWIPEYPPLSVELLDQGVFFSVVTLAILGTTRRSWPAWIFPVALWMACSLGQKTPHSPKVAILFPLLLLAPAGLDVLRSMRR